MAGEDLEPFRVDALTMGGLGGPAAGGAAQPAAPPGEGKADAGYPTLEGICAKRASFEAFSSKAEATQKALADAAQGGDAAAKAAAEKGLKAYGHLTETLGKLVELTVAEIKRRRQAAGK